MSATMPGVGYPGMSEPPVPGMGPGDMGPGPVTSPMMDQDHVSRDPPDVPEPRRKLVKRWTDKVTRARKYWEPVFKRMRENMEFAEGRQWPDMPNDVRQRDERYIANICIRHILQRTAELYPNNPKMVAKRSPKLMTQTWDGTQAMLMQAQQASLMAMQSGLPPDPMSAMVLQDAQMVAQFDRMMERVSKTLEILYDYQLREQPFDFKECMKMTVRRAIVTAVGYVKVGFQRAMQMSPEIEQRIADMSERLAHIEHLAGEIGDGEIEPDSADAESLKVAIQSLMQEPQLVLREGLAYDYPDSTAIIPDPKCRSLKGFVGADWVAQEYLLTPDEIEEIYMVDVGCSYTVYDDFGQPSGYQPSATLDHYTAGGGDSPAQPQRACLWEIYNRKDRTLYVCVDGYPDFVQEPGPPPGELTRFWPWFAFVMNEGYDEKRLYPQSDIDLIRDMQLELNRSRQGLREHRRANRPKIAVAAGLMEEPDLEKLRTHPANALLELNALAPGQKIEDVLQPVKMPPIDPAVYDTTPVFEDVLRVLGADQADQGVTTGDPTATEVSVAQFAQSTDTSSVVDDLNDMMSQVARAGRELLLLNVSQDIVTKVVGPGAVWPQLDRQTIADNVYLEVDVGANGPPDRQQDVQMLVQLVPLLQRVPGINPEWLARQLIRRMGDDIDLSEAFAEGLPSMEAINQLQGRPPAAPGAGAPPGKEAPGGAGKGPPRQGPPGQDQNAQGPGGASNAPGVPQPPGLGMHAPPMQVYGANGNRPGTGGAMPQGAMRNPGFPTP